MKRWFLKPPSTFGMKRPSLLSSPSAGKREREKKTAVSTVPAIAPTPTAVPFLKDPALKGEPCLIDPYPLGLRPENRAAYDALLEEVGGAIQAKLNSLMQGEQPAPTPLPRKSAQTSERRWLL